MIFLVIALGVVVGAVMGLVGAGGGIISVPALVGLVGVPVADAMTASLVMAIASASTAVVPRLRGGVDWPVAAAVSAAGIPAALVGTAVNALLPQSLLLIGFGALMLVAGVRMLRPIPDNASQGERQPRWLIHAILIGLGVGMLTGLLGVGGGFVIVPALALLLHLPMKLAIGTSLVVTVANSLAGAAAHASIGGIDVPLTVAFTIPAMIASLLGARLAAKLPGKGLQIGFAVLVLVIAVVTLVTTIIPLT
ncbi:MULTISPECIES: sulfite exporter TauE/SafE family protein [Microbacterium]|uniref:Probable membrane transporter protein n=1 Tax=Microbacterium maritypicum TaxID=33918 RepID=A0AAJ6APG4_MICMQ|nr:MULTISPECIES: sulfite exporter TauE/SafE family protein [Microbacterium]WEF21369.1 sulfite exporter TauE/SafE family protein [Microbacterium liquefaciens]